MHHLPNIITLARAVGGIVGAVLLWMSSVKAAEGLADAALSYGVAAAVIFVLAALSDWLDGWLARLMGVESALGALLDPIADKFLVGPYLIAYVVIAGFNPWLALPVAIIIGRDVLVTSLRLRQGLQKGAPNSLAVSLDAKVKTAIQMVMTAAPLVLVLAGFRDVAVWFYYWVGGVWFLAVLTVWTALPYWRAAQAK